MEKDNSLAMPTHESIYIRINEVTSYKFGSLPDLHFKFIISWRYKSFFSVCVCVCGETRVFYFESQDTRPLENYHRTEEIPIQLGNDDGMCCCRLRLHLLYTRIVLGSTGGNKYHFHFCSAKYNYMLRDGVRFHTGKKFFYCTTHSRLSFVEERIPRNHST